MTPDDKQSRDRPQGAVKKTDEPAKTVDVKAAAREKRLAEALRQNLRRRKTPQQQDTKDD